jgi:hypothetical protein
MVKIFDMNIKNLLFVHKFLMFNTNEQDDKMNTLQKTEKRDNIEQELLFNALTVFRREANLHLEEKAFEVHTNRAYVDAVIRLKTNDHETEFWVEIKPTVTDTVIGRLKHQFEEHPGRWLVVTRYIPQHLAKKMRELNIQFIDTVGNAYIDDPPILIFMHGNKPNLPLAFAREEGLLGRAGLHVVFALLCNRELEKATYRDIAQAANVALGTAAGVLKDLHRQGFLIELGGEVRKLTKKKELFDKWTTAYAERLRPKRLIGRYTANRPDFWQDINLLPYDAQWGGEVAANKMVHYLKPEVVTIYTRRPVNEIVLALKLRKNDEGNVELRERFWKFELGETKKDLVPPLLVYADLLATADARNVETAKMVYNEYLQRHFEQD